MPVPTVTYWFDVERRLTEFIDPHSQTILKIAESMGGIDDNNFIKKVAAYIRDKYQYPLNSKGEPATDHRWQYYSYGSTCPFRRTLNWLMRKIEYVWAREDQYLFNQYWWYVWQDPLMTYRTRFGICIDTALLCTSILRVRPHIPSYVEAGYVTLPNDNNRYGHAWTSIPSKDILIETTIHEPGKNNIVSYSKAVSEGINGVKYTPIDRWNESEYYSLGSWIQVGGFLLAPKSYCKKDLQLWKENEIKKQVRLWQLF